MQRVRYAGSLIMAATYGYEVRPEGDSLISRIRETAMMSGRVLVPERAILLMAFPFRTCETLVATIHLLDLLSVEYLPSWFPGAADRRLAPSCRKIVRQILDEPFEIAKAKIVCSSALSVDIMIGRWLDGYRTTVIYRGQTPE